MLRRFVQPLVVTSSLCCLCVAFFWSGIGHPSFAVSCGREYTEYTMGIDGHKLGLFFLATRYRESLPSIYRQSNLPLIRFTVMCADTGGPVKHFSRSFLGFALTTEDQLTPDGTVGIAATAIAIPYWALMLVFALGPAVYARAALLAYIHSRRLCLGLCPTCSYDLRASTDKCPECGSPIPTKDKGQMTKDIGH